MSSISLNVIFQNTMILCLKGYPSSPPLRRPLKSHIVQVLFKHGVGQCDQMLEKSSPNIFLTLNKK